MKNFFKKIVINLLTWQAKIVLKKNHPKIIAVTGNIGKTTTKDLIYTALKKNLVDEKGNSLVLASKKSMNSEFGIPLTILGMSSGWDNPFAWIKILLSGFIKIFDKFHYKYLILEVGADSPGDIEYVAKYIKPHVTILTGFAEVPVHIEFFDNDRQKLVREKKYLVEAVRNGGVFIYNYDDLDCQKIASEMSVEVESGKRKMSIFSFSIKNPEADVYTKNINTLLEEENGTEKISGISTHINLIDKEVKISLKGIIGEAIVYALMPALIVAEAFNIDIEKVVEDLEKSKRTPGRMRILEGIYGTTIIDDTYNSSPKAAEHGINVLRSIKTRNKKILILGDMLELGDFTKEEHKKIGEKLVGACDILITSGIRSKMTADSAIDHGMNGENVYVTHNSVEAGREVLRILDKEVEKDFQTGKTEKTIGKYLIFIKGSQGARMERVVKMILAENHDPEKLLVRQESIWETK